MAHADQRTDDDEAERRGSPQGSPSEEVLLRLLEECFLRLEEGNELDLNEICAENPELRERLEQLLEKESDFVGRARNSTRPKNSRTPPRIAGYTITEKIGAGGMGEVYAAVDPSLGREVALKVVARLGNDEAGMRRLKREAAIAAALDHPNIVPVYAVGETDDFAWIAMKLLSGPSLANIPQPLSPRDAAVFGSAIARALKTAHDEGVIHRDIKPANIVLDQDRAILCDFGLARALDRSVLTQSNAVAGTLPYMAPEQLDGSQVADPRTDIYGLCATLYEIVAGRPPFAAPNPDSLIRQIADRDPAPIGLSGADRDFETIVRRGLEKSPWRRFRTAGELADDLDRFVRGDAIESRMPSFFDSTIRRLRRRPRTTAAVSCLVLVLIGTWLWIAAAGRERRTADRLLLDRSARAADDGESKLASELLADLERRAPKTEGIAVERRRQDALMALDDLVDTVQSLTAQGDDSGRLARLRLLELGGAELRRPLSDLAQVAALMHDRAGEEARALIARSEKDFGSSRATTAFRKLIEAGDVGPPDLLPSPRKLSEHFDQFDDITFTSIALRISGGTIESRRAEIESAAVGAPSRYRTRYALGVLHQDAEDYQAAYAIWLGLHRSGTYRPAVISNLALAAMAMGRADLAALHIRSIPAEGRRRTIVRRTLEVLEASNRLDEFAKELERAALSDPADPWLRFRIGLTKLEAKDIAAAKEHLQFVVDSALSDTRTKHLARQGLVLAKMEEKKWLTDGTYLPLAIEHPEMTRTIDEIRALEKSAPDAHTKSSAVILRSRLQQQLGDTDSAWMSLEDALAADRDNPAVEIAWITETARRCLHIVQNKSDRVDPEVSDLSAAVATADRLMSDLLDPKRKGTRRPTSLQIRAALEAGLYLHLPTRNQGAFVEAENRLRARIDPLPAELAAAVAEIRKFLGL